MTYRTRNLLIAFALAALAAVLVSVYVTQYKNHVESGQKNVAVYVAARDIPAGTPGNELIDGNYLRKTTIERFGTAGAEGLRGQLSSTQRAIELDASPSQVLSGALKTGDHVDVVATWSLPEGSSHHVSRVVLRDLLVLAAPDTGPRTWKTRTRSPSKALARPRCKARCTGRGNERLRHRAHTHLRDRRLRWPGAAGRIALQPGRAGADRHE